jgi:peroxiredoxin
MARTNSTLLDKGGKFPEMEMMLTSGETVRLPEATGEGYGVLLFYRGYW